MGVEYIPSMPLYQLDGLHLKELGGRLDGVLEVSQSRNQVEVISGHVTKWTHIWIQTLLRLLQPIYIKFLLSCSRRSAKDVLKALNIVSRLYFVFKNCDTNGWVV